MHGGDRNNGYYQGLSHAKMLAALPFVTLVTSVQVEKVEKVETSWKSQMPS